VTEKDKDWRHSTCSIHSNPVTLQFVLKSVLIKRKGTI